MSGLPARILESVPFAGGALFVVREEFGNRRAKHTRQGASGHKPGMLPALQSANRVAANAGALGQVSLRKARDEPLKRNRRDSRRCCATTNLHVRRPTSSYYVLHAHEADRGWMSRLATRFTPGAKCKLPMSLIRHRTEEILPGVGCPYDPPAGRA
jgi:hypothetical protein